MTAGKQRTFDVCEDDMKHALTNLSAIASALLMIAAGPAHAQNDVVSKSNPELKADADVYWTPQRFKDAKPFPMPSAATTTQREAAPSRPSGKVESREGQPPSEQYTAPGEQLFAPDAQPRARHGDEVVEPGAVGAAGAPYTSTRVFPTFSGANAVFSADRAYPYITVGKLFFSIGGAPFVCSGAVIQRRVVATAGHCVHTGTSAGFHSNFVFVPSFRDGAAPFRSWNWRYVATTVTWATGGGGVPNAADYAMIEFGDQPLTPGAPASKLGNVVGFLGWQTLNLVRNHTSKLGYPCNLDNCAKMQNVMSNSFRTTAPNNVEYGSDATGGSSGGPWVQNFATLAVGGGTGSNTGLNQVVGVTSYIYNDVTQKVQGASILDSRWLSLFNLLCSRTGNCS
jgi:V8-like Glu-specific endopeptidase